jgi:formylglycine-generating enzyme required for sulfatase activity
MFQSVTQDENYVYFTLADGTVIKIAKASEEEQPNSEFMFIVTYDANGGEGVMQLDTFYYGVSKALTSIKYTNALYRFVCWNTKADGTGISYSDGQQLMISKNITLYAQWVFHSYLVNGVSFTMVAVEGGTFTMGATAEQGSEAHDDEYPTHSVTLSDFYIGETEVTQELWKAVMGSNPSYFSGTNLPVERVSWNDCQTFITKLNQLTGQNFRLPTEAEWEYAARGGNKSKGYKYAGSNNLNDVAWYSDNSSGQTHPIKQKQPNELGLYDMTGNVFEWCQDWYDSSYYSSSPKTNPTGPSTGSNRVTRGSSWDYIQSSPYVSNRYFSSPTFDSLNLGLRLAL